MKCIHKSRYGKCSNIVNGDECKFDKCQSQLKYMTNAERIRSMSDEKLAEYLCLQGWDMKDYRECLNWLKAEAEE